MRCSLQTTETCSRGGGRWGGGTTQDTNVIRWASSPVRVFLQHLVDADAEGLVIEALVDEIFIYPELGGSDRLALWDPRQVKSELFVMPPHRQELLIVLHCQGKTEKSIYVQFLEVDGGSQGLFARLRSRTLVQRESNAWRRGRHGASDPRRAFTIYFPPALAC